MALVTINAADKRGYGIIAGDGRDYTEELQAIANKAFKVIDREHDPCQVLLPPGPICHSETWVVKGNQACAPHVLGSHGDGAGIWGTRLVWTGAPDVLQLFGESFNRGRIWDVAFDGQDTAGRNVNISGSKYGDPEQLKASDGYSIQRCRFAAIRPGVEGNGCLAIGTDPLLSGGQEFQSSSWSIRDNLFEPERDGVAGFDMGGLKSFGFKTLAPGNCKSGEVLNNQFVTCGTAIDWGRSSGYLNVFGGRMANVRTAFAANSGSLNVTGLDVECNGTNGARLDDFRLLRGTAQIGAFASFRGLEVTWDTEDGVTPVLLDYGGALELVHNVFGYRDLETPFIMRHGAVVAPWTFGSFYSRQNWYRGCGADRPYIPLYDSNGNDLAPIPGTYGGSHKFRVKSRWDKGGTGASPIDLLEFDSTSHE